MQTHPIPSGRGPVSDGHFAGSAINNGDGTTSFYGPRGNFAGSAGSSIDRAFNFNRRSPQSLVREFPWVLRCHRSVKQDTDGAINQWYSPFHWHDPPREGHMAIHIRRREFIVTLLGGAAAVSAVCCERAAGSKRWIG